MAKNTAAEARKGKMCEQEAPVTPNEILGLLAAIVKDRKIPLVDRLQAIRIHSRWLGYRPTEVEIWSVITELANGE